MGRSEKTTDFWGNEYTQHYDDDGNKIAWSEEKTGFFGDKYTQNYDQDDRKTGWSEEKTGFFGDNYTQNYDQDDKKIGWSDDKTGFFGDRYTQHYDQDDRKTGWSQLNTGFFGDRYTEHYDQDDRKTDVHSTRRMQKKDRTSSKAGGTSSSRKTGGGLGLLIVIAFVSVWVFNERSRLGLDSDTTVVPKTGMQVEQQATQAKIADHATDWISPGTTRTYRVSGGEWTPWICSAGEVTRTFSPLDQRYDWWVSWGEPFRKASQPIGVKPAAIDQVIASAECVILAPNTDNRTTTSLSVSVQPGVQRRGRVAQSSLGGPAVSTGLGPRQCRTADTALSEGNGRTLKLTAVALRDYQHAFEVAMNAGYRPQDISVVEASNDTCLTVVFVANDGRAWMARHGLDDGSLAAEDAKWRSQGFRLIDRERYRDAGYNRWAAIWLR